MTEPMRQWFARRLAEATHLVVFGSGGWILTYCESLADAEMMLAYWQRRTSYVGLRIIPKAKEQPCSP